MSQILVGTGNAISTYINQSQALDYLYDKQSVRAHSEKCVDEYIDRQLNLEQHED